MAESPLIEAATRWVMEEYAYNNYHLVRSLEWLDRIAPASAEVRAAGRPHSRYGASVPGPGSATDDDL